MHPPPRPAPLARYIWAPTAQLSVRCWLDYEPAEQGSREPGTGLQLERDYPASMTLHSAYVGGINIYDALSAETAAEIEALAMAAHQ